MKKKLLTLLLSIVVILTSTVTVFAKDTKKSGDIFNTVNDVNKWTNEHGAVFADLYDYNDLLNQDAESEDGVIYRFSCGNENYALTIMNDKLFSIEVSNCPAETYNGTYTLTIASILPSNFPASAEDNSWCESVNGNVYIYKKDSNLVFNDKTEDCYSVPLSSSLTKEENPEISYVYSAGETEIQFNMTGDNNDELKNIVVNKCTIFACVGTYAAPKSFSVTYNANGATSGSAPADQTKTAGVELTLATNTGNLTKTDYTFNGWNTKADGSGTHYDTGAAYTTDAALTLYAEWTGASATKTIADILDKAVGGFPTSQSNAWVDPSYDYIAYKSNNLLYIKEESSITILTFIDVNKNVSKVSDSQYKYHDSIDSYDVLFNLVKDKLVSIELTGMSDYRSVLNRTYEAPKTIANILPEDFPTTKNSGWLINGDTNNYRAYIDGTDLKVANGSVSLNSVLKKDGDNYKITSGGPTYIFKMESNILKSINYSVMGSGSGEYIPYKYEVKPTSPIPKGSTSNQVFETNGIYVDGEEANVEVKLDGQLLTLNTHYTLSHGSIKVTLLGSYIKDLDPGTYTISIGVKDGISGYKFEPITSQFTITDSSPAPSPSPSSDTTSGYKIPKTGIE